MVENLVSIQLIFAEIFVPQDFINRTTLGLSGPTNTCATKYEPVASPRNVLTVLLWARCLLMVPLPGPIVYCITY